MNKKVKELKRYMDMLQGMIDLTTYEKWEDEDYESPRIIIEIRMLTAILHTMIDRAEGTAEAYMFFGGEEE
jgi:hypothetical protein